MTIYLLNYNNYYNRIIKREDSIEGYLPYLSDDIVRTGINFIPGDGITTQHIVKTQSSPDYFIVCDEYNEIVSRWFVVEQVRTTGGQYRLSLQRDTIADFYNSVLNAPAFIEKATLPFNDPAIYNSENMTFNQIKTSQTTLKDKSNVAWLVGYLSPELDSDKTFNFESYNDYDIVIDGDINSWEYNKYTSQNCLGPSISAALQFYIRSNIYPAYASTYYSFDVFSSGRPKSEYLEVYLPYCKFSTDNFIGLTDIINAEIIKNRTEIQNLINSRIEDYYDVLNLNGKTIKTLADNKLYSITVETKYIQEEYTITPGSGEDYKLTSYVMGQPSYQSNDYNSYFNNRVIEHKDSSIKEGFKFIVTEQVLTLSLTTLEPNTSSFSLSRNSNVLLDNPFRMVCMPFSKTSDFTFYRTVNGELLRFTSNSNTCMGMMQEIIKAGSGNNGYVYDVQLLPYCPCLDRYYDELLGSFNLDLETRNPAVQGKDYEFITGEGKDIVGLVLYPTKSTFSVNIDYTVVVDDIKISNECDKYRLCSPNYNGAFDLNVAKNNGVNGIIANCTYKPYNPYIKVAPIFSGLYGNNFTDPRGLICGGDFSLPMLSDKWQEFERNNKNYQKAFERQIDNLEIKQNVSRIQDIASAVVGTAQGAVMGGKLSGNVGGAIAGGLGSAITGGVDIAMNEILRQETIDYTKDQFGYSLGNIQALPYSLSKVGAYNADNTIFPVVEYYTCTEVERQALRDKLKYNGMTVMRIGTIKEFIREEYTYIKGKIIRIEDIKEDYHVVNVIATEINKGVFIK